MASWYNENDGYAAAWLRNLIRDGELPDGIVDERSIVDVRGDDLRGFDQCHFFAGIGGWPRALRDAGWPEDRPVWTGSCPCQPLSVAGQRKGHVDGRHLWPSFHRLIAECRPASVFGEQVASKDGREWMAAVRADLEGDGYAVGCAVLPAAGIGAPHLRYRLFFVADADDAFREAGALAGTMGTEKRGSESAESETWLSGKTSLHSGAAGFVADAEGGGWREERENAGRIVVGDQKEGPRAGPGASSGDLRPRPPDRFWRDADWIFCRDGKWRPVEPGTFPLASGISNRVGRLRGYGNAVCLPVATEFVAAFLDMIGQREMKCDEMGYDFRGDADLSSCISLH